MNAKDKVFCLKKTLNLKGNLIDLSTPIVMGILNVTPDSFYDGGRYTTNTDILKQAEKIIKEGGTVIDVGGYSSRPGAEDIPEAEELKRVTKSINTLIKSFPEAYISVDTFRAGVAKAAIEEGACMINDISGGNLDKKMFATVAELNVPYVLMHMKGTPQNMISQTVYKDLLLDMLDYFQKKTHALVQLGVKDLILDPGFGFSKSMEQNYEILKNLDYFQVLNLPVLLGVSRKSTICKSLNVKAGEALNGTTVLNTIGLINGGNILRVHDVKEAMEAIKLYKLTYN